jgi:hypothetical protein
MAAIMAMGFLFQMVDLLITLQAGKSPERKSGTSKKDGRRGIAPSLADAVLASSSVVYAALISFLSTAFLPRILDKHGGP